MEGHARGPIPISVQFRFKHPWRDKNGNTGDTWVLANSYPEKGPDGKLKSIFGSVTDISSQKFAEDLQKRRMEEAMELKRQQENFIDITSHEMRNPLSAILQCADEISATLSELRMPRAVSLKYKQQSWTATSMPLKLSLYVPSTKRGSWMMF